MSFWIQTGNPSVLEVGEEVDNFYEAIGEIYSADTEYLIISWNLVPVAVHYSEDLYVFADQIITLLEKLKGADFADSHITTGASSFFVTWQFRADGGDLVIDSRWESVLGGYEFLLNERSQLTVPRADFIAEWMKVIRRVVEDITAQAVRMEDDSLFVRAKALLAAAGDASGAPGATGGA